MRDDCWTDGRWRVSEVIDGRGRQGERRGVVGLEDAEGVDIAPKQEGQPGKASRVPWGAGRRTRCS